MSERRKGSPGRRRLAVIASVLTLGAVAWALRRTGSEPDAAPKTSAVRPPALSIDSSGSAKASGAAVQVPACEFTRGRTGGNRDAEPARRIKLQAFEIDAWEVSNARFRAFVESTGHVTTAERLGYGRVFDFDSGQVKQVPGANWKHPTGPKSTIVGRENHPVVQVSWFDANAFANWDGKRLPTEAQFECAARSRLNDYDYPWGSHLRRSGVWLANTWQGDFPFRPKQDDNYIRLAPVSSFPPSPIGLHNMVGNVREWCRDWYRDDYYQIGAATDPEGPERGSHRAIRGGSWMDPEENRQATVWARDHQRPDWFDDQTGFRCVKSL